MSGKQRSQRCISSAVKAIFIDYPHLIEEVTKGQTVFIDDGAINLTVLARDGDCLRCRVNNTAPLSSRKGVNLPGAKVTNQSTNQFTPRKDNTYCAVFARPYHPLFSLSLPAFFLFFLFKLPFICFFFSFSFPGAQSSGCH